MSDERPTRRRVLQIAGGLFAASAAGAAYAVGIEPMRLDVRSWTVSPVAPWPVSLRLRIVALADLHVSEPFMTVARVRSIADQAMALEPDLIVLLGDYVAGSRWVSRFVPAGEWAPALGGLRAPLGVFAILGNHDWWDDRSAQQTGETPLAGRALKDVGIRLLQNEAVALRTRAGPVWLAGLGDQLAFLPARKRDSTRREGADDLPGTLAAIPTGAPTILLAHEPDIFPKVPSRVALTLSGHTHGGQVRAFGYSPLVPSRYRNRYAYGHVREHADLVVSGGLGTSIVPIRFGVPPEITLVELGGAS